MEKGNINLTYNIKNLWLSCYPNDVRNIEGYFLNHYKPENTIIETKDNIVVSFLAFTPTSFMLNGRILKTSNIENLGTLKKYRNQGYMSKILETYCDILDNTELISFASSGNKQLLEKYGFKTIFKKNRYKITRDNIQRITNDGCGFDPTSLDMIRLYSQFLKRFTGYKVRTIKEFDEYKKSIYDRGGKIVSYYEENILKGYAVLIIENKEIEIEECMYVDTISLLKLLNVALQQRHIVYLNVSEYENLSALLGNVIPETIEYKMARLNNKDLFNRLFNTNINDVEEAFYLTNKPPYSNI